MTPRDRLAPLHALRSRLRRQRRLVDAAWVVSGGLGAAALVFAAGRLAGGDALVPAASLGALAALAVAAIRAWRHRRHPWSVLRVARYADHRSSWREQVSTAVEYADDDRPIAHALRDAAEEVVAGADPVALGPWRWPRAPSLALSLSVAALLVATSLSVPGTGTPDGTGVPLATDTPSAEALLTLADRVESDARRRRDAYLDSLADALRDLADAPEARAPDASSVERLLERIAEAYGDDVNAADLRNALATTDAALDAARRAADGDPSAAVPPPPATRMQVGGSDPDMDFGAIFRDPPANEGASAGAGGSDSAPGGDTRLGIADPASVDDPDAATMVDVDGLPGGAGASLGAADTSGAGASTVAGRGSQDLDGDATQGDLTASDTEAIAVRGVERDDGRRIDIELPPATAWEGYDPDLFTVGAWRAAPEAPQPDLASPLVYRSAAARFFLPSQATATTP